MLMGRLPAHTLQGGRSSRQSEGGDPGIQIFVKSRRQQQPDSRKADSQATGDSAQNSQMPRLAAAAGSRQDARRPPSRQSSGRLQTAAAARPQSRGAANASAQGGPASRTGQPASLVRQTSDPPPPLPLLHLLQAPAAAQPSAVTDGFAPLNVSAPGAPGMMSESYLASLRGTLAGSDADSMNSRGLDGVLSSCSAQLPPEQPGRQQSAGVSEFRAALAAETATATAALAAQVRVACQLKEGGLSK